MVRNCVIFHWWRDSSPETSGFSNILTLRTKDKFTSLQPWLIQRLERKFLESFLQLLELKCMAVEEKQLYLRGGSRAKIEPCLNMLERSAEEGTEDLYCELGAWKKCVCNPADRLQSCLITKWQWQNSRKKKLSTRSSPDSHLRRTSWSWEQSWLTDNVVLHYI